MTVYLVCERTKGLTKRKEMRPYDENIKRYNQNKHLWSDNCGPYTKQINNYNKLLFFSFWTV